MPALDEAQLSAARERTFELLPVARNREGRSEEHTSELQSQSNLVCRLLLEKKKILPRCSCRVTCTSSSSRADFSLSPRLARISRAVATFGSAKSCALALPLLVRLLICASLR